MSRLGPAGQTVRRTIRCIPVSEVGRKDRKKTQRRQGLSSHRPAPFHCAQYWPHPLLFASLCVSCGHSISEFGLKTAENHSCAAGRKAGGRRRRLLCLLLHACSPDEAPCAGSSHGSTTGPIKHWPLGPQECCYSIATGRRAAFLPAWWDLSASIRLFAPFERLRF